MIDAHSEQLYYVAGQVSALHAILMAVVNTHPDPARLGKELEELVQVQLALTTPIPLSETFFDAQENAIKHFTSRIAELSARKER